MSTTRSFRLPKALDKELRIRAAERSESVSAYIIETLKIDARRGCEMTTEGSASIKCSECEKVMPWDWIVCIRPRYCPICGSKVTSMEVE